MLILLFLRINWKNLIQKEDKPYFLEIPTNDDDLGNFEGRYEVDTQIKDLFTVSTKRLNEYFLSSVHIDNSVKFSNNYAFGAGLAAGSGGAIFVSYCTLQITGAGASTFYKNEASNGGAICCFISGMYANPCPLFKENHAFRYGGAIYFHGSFINGKTDETQSNLYYYTGTILNIRNEYIRNDVAFESNYASELGGAIAFSMSAPCGIENIEFKSNEAGLSGGALYSFNCPLSIIKCRFITNNAGEISRRLNYQTNRFTNPNRPNLVGRGGGAIYFSCDEYIHGYNNPSTASLYDPSLTRQLYTDGCCWHANQANHAHSFGSGPGNDIFLNGYVTWSSFDDHISNYRNFPQLSVSGVSNPLPDYKGLDDSTMRPKYWHVYLYRFHADKGECHSDAQNPINDEEKYRTFTGIRIAFTYTSYIPSPTTFIYYATPITKLPYKTTSSWSKYTAPTFSSPPTARTVARTVCSTPLSTPLSTPEITPYKTPLSSPFKTPYTTPIKTPLRTISQTLDKTPILTPYKTPVTTEYDTPIPPDESNQPTKYPTNLYTQTYLQTQINTSTVISKETFIEYTVMTSLSDSTIIYITFENTHIIFSYVSYYVTDTEIFTFILFYDVLQNEDNGSGGLSPTNIIIISVICGVVGFIVLAVLFYLFRKHSQKDDDDNYGKDNIENLFNIDNENDLLRNQIYDDHENLDDPITIFSHAEFTTNATIVDDFNTTNDPTNIEQLQEDDKFVQQLYF